MRRWLVWLALVACQAHGQTQWFTVTGNPADASVDTVQVDPVATKIEGAFKTMNVRVSRARNRLNWEKVPYRSYESKVVFDCRVRKASYVFASFYATPLWEGTPHETTDYSGNPRPMQFVGIEPNPTARIIRAACRSSTG